MSRKIMKKNPCDVCFVIDTTQSTSYISHDLMDFVLDLAFSVQIRYRIYKFTFGAVINRDPIDYKPTQSGEFQESQKPPKENQEEEEERQHSYDRVSFPFDKNVPIDFLSDIEDLDTNLEKVEFGSGNGEQSDWVGALQCALDELQWRQDSKKVIVWISGSNAHGKRFCGIDNHNEEEIKFVHLIERAAEEGFNFITINLHKENNEGCKKTLVEMKNIFMNSLKNRKSGFIINENCSNMKHDYDQYIAKQFNNFLD